MKSCKKMKQTIEIILKAHNKLDDFNSPNDFQFKIDNLGYLPLHIEKCGNLISIAHYYDANGDLVPDPVMTFKVVPVLQPNANVPVTNGWQALNLQNNLGSYFSFDDDKDSPQLLTSFAEMWATNLNEQGFVK